MLQDSAGRINQKITISALIKATDRPNALGIYPNNPFFHPDWWEHNANGLNINKYIDSVDLEVYYYGKHKTALHWFRFETPNAQNIFRGVWDSLVKSKIDTFIVKYKDRRLNKSGVKLFRFYAMDEFNEPEYASMRYFNLLFDKLAHTETGFNKNVPDRQNANPILFYHATEFKAVTNGTNLGFLNRNPAPYIKYGFASNVPADSTLRNRTNNYIYGYNGNHAFWQDTLGNVHNTSSIFDPLASSYETYKQSPGEYEDYANLQGNDCIGTCVKNFIEQKLLLLILSLG